MHVSTNKSGNGVISIQRALVYCRIFGQDFSFLSSFMSVRLAVLGNINVHID